MKVRELIEKLSKFDPDYEAVIPVKRPGRPSIGAQSTVAIDDPHIGIDWDSGKVFIGPYRYVLTDDSKIRAKQLMSSSHQ